MEDIVMRSKRFHSSILIIALWLIAMVVTTSSWGGTLQDNFEDGDFEGWTQIVVGLQPPATWNIINGELHVERPSGWSSLLIVGNTTWKDYEIEYDVKPLEKLGQGDIDVVARVIDGNRMLACIIGDFLGGAEATGFRWAGGIENPKSKPWPLLKLGKWHHLKLKTERKHLIFWIDDQKVLEYSDNTLTEGGVGFGLSNYTARFDNIVVRGEDVPDTGPSGINSPFSVQRRDKLVTTWGEIKRGR